MKKLLFSLGAIGLTVPMTLGVACSNKDSFSQEDDVSHAGENLIKKNFLAYYRAWRDVEMEGVNTDLPDKNWMTMNDIPYGINIVNIFSYVPKGQEQAAQPYFDKLASDYGSSLHARGIKLIRGFDYNDLFMLNKADYENPQYEAIAKTRETWDYEGEEPTSKQVEDFTNDLIEKLMVIGGFKLDGLDIDMEKNPDQHQIEISNAVILKLAEHIGPQSENKDSTLFLYDTNGENLSPFKDVADSFNLLAYQQYGSDSTRTKDKVLPVYEPIVGKNKIMPGLTFPEEKDQNRWHDTSFPYEKSHFYDVAKFVNDHDLGGMFVYALDRDGRNYEDDFTTIRESNLLWTKTAILESNGVSLPTARDLALHHLERIQYCLHLSKPKMTKLQTAINNAKNLLEITAIVMGYDYPEGISPTYDPILENSLFKIDLTSAHQAINKARELIGRHQISTNNLDQIEKLKKELEQLLGSKQFSQEELNMAVKNLNDYL